MEYKLDGYTDDGEYIGHRYYRDWYDADEELYNQRRDDELLEEE